MAMPLGEDSQNSDMTSASLHEVPLSNDEPEDHMSGTYEKVPNKNSSLKRFFKRGLCKRESNDDANVENRDVDIDYGTEDKEEQDLCEHHKNHNEEIIRSRSRRFNFRFHGNNAENDTPSSSGNPPTVSRHSLRGSLSQYFSSVFKRKSSKHLLRFTKKKDSKIVEEEETPTPAPESEPESEQESDLGHEHEHEHEHENGDEPTSEPEEENDEEPTLSQTPQTSVPVPEPFEPVPVPVPVISTAEAATQKPLAEVAKEKVTEDVDIAKQTAEIINEVETLTIRDQ